MIRDRAAERRHFPRAAVASRTTLRARVRPGHDVRLVDLSRGGALVQTTSRLLPGSHVELQLSVGTWRWSTTALVVRARVWTLFLEEQVRYRVGVQFSRPMDIGTFDEILGARRQQTDNDGDGYQLPAAGSVDPI